MRYFKTEASRLAPRYEISEKSFVEHTERKHPFEQKGKKGERVQYGICPSCLNPIRLIGISHSVKQSVHGRHAGEDIDGLPKWDYSKYVYCPFADPNARKSPERKEKLEDIDENTIEIYNLLKSQFDRVVYILSVKLGIKCSDAFWERALDQFIQSKDYLYPWLTEANLPYIFAYFGVHLQSAYKQRFEIGTDLYKVLSNYPKARFTKVVFAQKSESSEENNKTDIRKIKYEFLENAPGKHFNPQFRFTDHKQKSVDGQRLIETMKFCIDDIDNGTTIYEKTIEFDETFFMNLINKGNEENRQIKLLNIAEKIMEPLEFP